MNIKKEETACTDQEISRLKPDPPTPIPNVPDSAVAEKRVHARKKSVQEGLETQDKDRAAPVVGSSAACTPSNGKGSQVRWPAAMGEGSANKFQESKHHLGAYSREIASAIPDILNQMAGKGGFRHMQVVLVADEPNRQRRCASSTQ